MLPTERWLTKKLVRFRPSSFRGLVTMRNKYLHVVQPLRLHTKAYIRDKWAYITTEVSHIWSKFKLVQHYEIQKPKMSASII